MDLARKIKTAKTTKCHFRRAFYSKLYLISKPTTQFINKKYHQEPEKTGNHNSSIKTKVIYILLDMINHNNLFPSDSLYSYYTTL